MDLALNNLQWLICHETKSNQTRQWKQYYKIDLKSNNMDFFQVVNPFDQ